MIVFDLGNVLLRLRFDRFVSGVAGVSGRSQASVRSRYILGERKFAFERGETAEEAFFTEMMNWLDWPADGRARLVGLWADVFDEIPRVASDVERLAGRDSLWVFSDTNVTHHRHVAETFPFLRYCSRFIASYETGRLKSSPEAFAYLASACDTDPSDVLYFDDLSVNVRNGWRAGFAAHEVSGWDDVMGIVGR